MTTARDFLVQSQNPDGGWGYRVQGMSYIEPTAAALIALNEANPRARDFLIAHQHADGGWGIAAIDPESGWMTAWAVRALTMIDRASNGVARGAQWLIATEGLQLTDPDARATTRKIYQIDSTLRGWPWQPGDAAWVHPTALAMVALIAAGYRDDARVREGAQYLYDRAILSGGWNIGNPWMLGKPIPATIQDTAIALIALRAFGAADVDEPIANAIRFLHDAIPLLKTPAELAWAMWAMEDWTLEIKDARARLTMMQQSDGSWQGNPFITAIALASGNL